MSSRRTAWHFFFCILLRRYGPATFQIRDEVPLSEEPPRMDYLFLRRTDEVLAAAAAQTLYALWPLLPLVTIAELKSIGRLYAKGELDRLWAYAHMYCAAEREALGERKNLATLLFVPGRTPSLDGDIDEMGLVWVALGGGYWRVTGGLFTLYVVEIDVVADQPDEDLLALYSHHEVRTPRATRFWGELTGAEAKMDARNLEGYEDEIKAIMSAMPPELRMAGLPPEQRMAGLPPELRMAGLPPEQRVAGLPPEPLVLGLPDEILRELPEKVLAHLSPETVAAIRERLGRV